MSTTLESFVTATEATQYRSRRITPAEPVEEAEATESTVEPVREVPHQGDRFAWHFWLFSFAIMVCMSLFDIAKALLR